MERKPNYPIESMILNRRSLRAMTGDSISDEELFTLFEAARWAPSSYNGQPWRFIYGKKGTKHFESLYSLLIEFNQQWTKNAAVLICIISRTTFEKNDKPAITHSFDTGSAFENLCLQGTSMGLVVHGMQGFNYEKAKISLNVPDNYQVEAMVAVGKEGAKETLPQDLLEKEVVSQRKPLDEIIFEGSFK